MRGTRGRGARGREGWMRGREVQECRRTGKGRRKGLAGM